MNVEEKNNYTIKVVYTVSQNKKLSCRRQTSRGFVSLNILLSHSRSLKVVRNDTVDLGVCKSLLIFHWSYVCISYHFQY